MALFMGGTLSERGHIEFANELGAAVISETNLAVSVTGYKGRRTLDETAISHPSFGFCVATGAEHAAASRDNEARIFTQVGYSEKRSEYFTVGQVINPRGRIRNAQQLAAISSSSVVCLASGAEGTRLLYEFALGLERPVLPLPFLGGMANKIWKRRNYWAARAFEIPTETAQRWGSVNLSSLTHDEVCSLAKETAACLEASVRKRCLVFMPFTDHFSWVLEELVQPAAEKASIDLVRIDLQDHFGDIVESFKQELLEADLVIAVVTGESPNVLYEVGYAHALNKPVLLLCQRNSPKDDHQGMPFYVRNHRTEWYPSRFDEEGIKRAIEEISVAMRNFGQS
jgi:hypothetical protein